jgi:hypothetical protein
VLHVLSFFAESRRALFILLYYCMLFCVMPCYGVMLCCALFLAVLCNVCHTALPCSASTTQAHVAQPVNRERFISKMFLRGDSVVLVLANKPK